MSDCEGLERMTKFFVGRSGGGGERSVGIGFQHQVDEGTEEGEGDVVRTEVEREEVGAELRYGTRGLSDEERGNISLSHAP